MNIIYGNNEVLFDGESNSFCLFYKGGISIIGKDDNIFIIAGKNKIIGITLDKSSLPESLFKYTGTMNISHGDFLIENEFRPIGAINIYDERWFKNGSNWESINNTWEHMTNPEYKNIPYSEYMVVNNNLSTEYDGQYVYSNKEKVPKDEPIHIYANGRAMTGGVKNIKSRDIFDHNIAGRKLKTNLNLGIE